MADIFIAYGLMGFLFGTVVGLGITIGKGIYTLCVEFIHKEKREKRRKQQMKEVCLEVLTEMTKPKDEDEDDNK